MAPTPRSRRSGLGADRVREHLLTSLHLGRLAPGDRVVSVRRLAGITGLNRKTIHRAYVELAREGLLLSRPGSGTFVADGSTSNGRGADAGELMQLVERCRHAAQAHGMTPDAFAAFVGHSMGDGLRGLALSVVECNLEQIGVIAGDLRNALGVEPRGLALRNVLRDPAAAAGTAGIVTTDCHYAEVAAATASTGLPVYRVALDGDFPKQVLRLLRRAPIVLVVRDASFERPFRRLLMQLSSGSEPLARLHVATPGTFRAALAAAGAGAMLCVSPLVAEEVESRLPASTPRIPARWTVPSEAIERLRAEIARDLAYRRASAEDRPGA